MNVREICEFFWFVENKYGLLRDPVKQRYWAPLRFKLYYFITQRVGLFENPHPNIQKSKNAGGFLKFFKKNPFFTSTQNSNVLFPSVRKINGEDIYSSDTLKMFKDNLDVIDQEAYGKSLEGAFLFDSLIHLGDFIFKIIRKITKYFPPKELPEVTLWLEEFSHRFNIPLKDIQSLYVNNKIKFNVFEAIYFCLFSFKKYKTVYIVGSYFQMYVVSSAKRAGSKVIELQHGVITPYHLGFSYPGQETNYFFPDELWCFGKFWSENTLMPKNASFKIFHPSFMKRLSGHSNGSQKQKNLVMFSSQGVVGTQIFEFSLAVARLNLDFKIVFRLHPNEDLRKYQSLLSNHTNVPQNFTLSHKDPNIFLLMSQAEYVVGVFSTTLFEAIYLKAKIVLLDMAGVEYMESVIARNEATLIKRPEEFRSACEKAISVESSYYYSDVTLV